MADDFFEGFPSIPDWDMKPSETEFDYSRWAPSGKMHICNVTWGTSEVQVLNRAITGQGNVVYFEGGEEERDKWFDENAQGVSFDIVYRGFDQEVYSVPLPFDVVCNYNYLWIEYEVATGADNPIDNETQDGTRRVFFFIRDIKTDKSAPNCTRVTVMPDYWTTFVYKVKFTGMMLERGHWAVANSADVDTYLENPSANTAYLTTPDVQPQSGYLGRIALRETFNSADDGTCYAVTAWKCSTTAAVESESDINSIKASTWATSAGGGYNISVMTLGDYYALFDKISSDGSTYSHLIAAFIATFYVSGRYIDISDKYEIFGFSGIYAYHLDRVHAPVLSDKLTLSKSMFSYPDEYAGYTKLYTSPYALVSITTNTGEGWDVPPEALHALQVATTFCYEYPTFGMRHEVVGASTWEDKKTDSFPLRTYIESTNIDYYDSNTNSMRWFTQLVPHFALTNAANYFKAVYYNTRDIQLWNMKALYSGSAVPSKTTITDYSDYSLAYQSNFVPYINQYTSNACIVTNNSASYATEKVLNSYADTKLTLDNTADKAYIDTSTDITNESTAAITSTQNSANSQATAVGAVGTIANGVIGGFDTAIQGAASGNPLSLAAGAVGGLLQMASSAVNAGVSVQQTNITNTAATEVSNIAISKNTSLASASKTQISSKQSAALTYADNNVEAQNDLRVTATSNSNSAALTQAKRIKELNDDYVTQNYNFALANFKAAPKDYKLAQGGMTVSGDSGNDLEMMTGVSNVTVSVQTLPKGEVKRIGDIFAAYGYTCNTWVHDENGIDLNVMPTFTYWQASKIHAVYQMPDAFADRLRILLLGGITVYRKPEDVGKGVVVQ